MHGTRMYQGYLLIFPTLLVIFGFIFFPVGYSVWLSFTNKHTINPDFDYVGFSNYFKLLKEPIFWQSFWRGTIWAVSTIILQVVLGLAAALLLNQPFRGRGVVRGFTLFPYMLPTIVTILLWKWMLSATYGPVNYFLETLGILDEPLVWLGPSLIMASTILVGVWQFFPFVVISLLARLQTIDITLYEAAQIDGASVWKRFFHITLPQLRNVLFVVVLLRTFFMFTKFDVPWLMATGGGLQEYIQNMPVYAYRKTFRFFQAGQGACISVILFLMLVTLTVLFFGLYRREEEG
ncbi:MAG: sugar ABC transporter permease [Deltaproteobacteria bacterium]|nr:sugar ABC transporter permease [Deltaproteobacteria bacterium]MBW2152382.1 sugar ABC transporter permease [Deltaproteobacteria bacterium]